MFCHVAHGATAAGKCKSRAEASSRTATARGRGTGAGPAPFQSALRPNREKMTQRLEPEGRLQGLLVDTVQMTS